MSEDLVVVEIARQQYALPVRQVREVLPRAALTMLPGAPASVLGILSLRGTLLLVLDLRQRLGLPVVPAAISQCIVVVVLPQVTVGVLVDAVAGIVEGSGLAAPAATRHADAPIRQVTEIDGHVVSVLDPATIVGAELAAYASSVAPRADPLVSDARAIGAAQQVRR